MTTKAAKTASKRPFDIVVYGATGFTGKLTAEYLVRSQGANPLKLAIAGRNRGKVEACQQDLLSINSQAHIETLHADSDDYTSLVNMAAQAKVVEARKIAAYKAAQAKLATKAAAVKPVVMPVVTEAPVDAMDADDEEDWAAEMETEDVAAPTPSNAWAGMASFASMLRA